MEKFFFYSNNANSCGFFFLILCSENIIKSVKTSRLIHISQPRILRLYASNFVFLQVLS